MHPWYGIGFLERKQKHAEMREWLRANKCSRIKAGTKREDGKVFCGYGVGYANGEQWSDPSVLEKSRRLCRENMKKMRRSPAYREAYAAYCRQRYADRFDVRKNNEKRVKDWASANPHRINQRAAKRRAIKRSLHHPQHDQSVELRLHEEAKRMTAETGIEHHVDHIIPIKHGGFHHHQNLQVLPANVNLAKSSTPFWVSSTYKDFRSVPQWLWPESLVDFYLAIRSV